MWVPGMELGLNGKCLYPWSISLALSFCNIHVYANNSMPLYILVLLSMSIHISCFSKYSALPRGNNKIFICLFL